MSADKDKDFFAEEHPDDVEAKEAAEAEKADAAERSAILDLKKTLEHDYARRVLWGIIEDCNVFLSIWDPSGKIHYNAGRQDVGQNLLLKIGRADPHLLGQMMREQYTKKLKESQA